MKKKKAKIIHLRIRFQQDWKLLVKSNQNVVGVGQCHPIPHTSPMIRKKKKKILNEEKKKGTQFGK